MKIIYPCDYFNLKQPDELFLDEAVAFKINGFDISVNNGKPIKEGVYIYRGWMLSDEEYSNLEIFMANNNAKILTTKEQYFQAHYLPNWYEKLKEFTPETIVTSIDDLDQTLEKCEWQRYFVKDYVKSLTTSTGSIANSKEEVKNIVNELKSKRSIEGGICLRKVMDFDTQSEIRYYSLNGKILSPNGVVPDIVKQVSNIANLPFISIDIIKDRKGKEWLVEIGDGQVSDLKSPWTPELFSAQVKIILNPSKKNKPSI